MLQIYILVNIILPENEETYTFSTYCKPNIRAKRSKFSFTVLILNLQS